MLQLSDYGYTFPLGGLPEAACFQEGFLPPFRTASAASGDFDPESPRRNSQTGEFGPTPVNTFAPSTNSYPA
ncbi:hypothetical protein Ndes2437B_g01471 [Nannochloris sp. 'desiccata']